MAKRKYEPKTDGEPKLRQDEKVAQAFAEQLIKKLEGVKQDWKKPWFSDMNMGAPRNFDGRKYTGMNHMFLAMLQEMKGYQLPVWMTFQKAKELGVNVLKGEESALVWLGSKIILDENGKKLTNKEFNELSQAEKEKCQFKPFAKAFNVFNIQQTNYPEIHPEEYTALKEKMMVRPLQDAEGMFKSPALDHMIQNGTWLCPIEPKQGDSAYYSISKDHIIVPLKEQFVSGEHFYKTLLHEMAHSTGAEGRLERIKPAAFGSEEYAREELVAEMTSAVVANGLGISAGIKEDSVPYLQSWLDALKESPKFMLTLMKDVNKACAMIEEEVYNQQVGLDAEKGIERIEEEKKMEEKKPEVSMEKPEEVQAQQVPQEAQMLNQEGYKPQVYGQEQAPKLHMAYLGNGISAWEDGDNDYTAHISPQRELSMDKNFSPENVAKLTEMAEKGNMLIGNDDTRALALNPLNPSTMVIYNKAMDEAYRLSKETVRQGGSDIEIYCYGHQVMPDTVKEKAAEIRYPQQYVFSITGVDNVRPRLADMMKLGVDVSAMGDEFLEVVDQLKEQLTQDQQDFKVFYFKVEDNRITGFHRNAAELGKDLPQYWFSGNALKYNHPGKSTPQSMQQALAGSEYILKVVGPDSFKKLEDALAEKGVAVLPEQLKLIQWSGGEGVQKQRYFSVSDGIVTDSEATIDEKAYKVPMYQYDGQGFTQYDPAVAQKQSESINLNNDKRMTTNNNEAEVKNTEAPKKELKDGLYVFPMKSGDWGINEVKGGVATPTIQIPKDSAELKAFKAATTGNTKEVRDAEMKKLAAVFLTPENIAKAEERKTQQNNNYIRLAQVKPEVAERIANVHTFKMQDGKTMAVSAEIDGNKMVKPMGEKLQNTFFAKAKGTTGEEKKQLDVQVAAMVFRKELEGPKVEQEQNINRGMKR